MLSGAIQLRGHYIIREASSGLMVAESDNLVTSAGKQLVADMLRDVSGFDTGLTFLALSTNTTAPTVADTTLAGEVNRKAFSSNSRSGNSITLTAFFTAAEATYHIRKVGVWGHSTASAAAGSGVLFSASLVDYDNSAGAVDLVIDYVLEVK